MKTYNWYLYGTPGNYRVTTVENARRYVMNANETRKVCADTLYDAISVCRDWLIRDGDTLTIDPAAH